MAGYVYGMVVKNCYVDDGQGNKVELLDGKGCPVDRHLLPQLTYDPHHISAHVQTHVFKVIPILSSLSPASLETMRTSFSTRTGRTCSSSAPSSSA